MIRKVFSLFVLLSVLCGFTAVNLNANGLNLNGMGSKAIAMGGAFVGLADDYSAVYWNPAGLVQMKDANLSLSIVDIIPNSSYQFDMYGISAETESKMYPSGSLAYFKPLSDKLVVGLAAYVPSGLGAAWDGADLALLAGGQTYEWESFFAIVTVSPAISYKVSDCFSVGATINFNYGMLKLHRPALGQYEESLSTFALGATFGALYKPSDKFSIGVTLKTPMKATFSGEATMSAAGLYNLPTTDTAERTATMPLWIGAGIAFKPMDKLTITADLQYTNWTQVQDILVTYENPYWEAMFAEASALDLRWEDKIQYRFGMQYQVSDSFALRAGYYYDPSPAPLGTLNVLLPQTTYNWITLGFGYHSDSFSIDVAVEKAWGEERTVGLTDAIAGAGMPGLHKTDIIVPNIAFTYKFGKK